MYDVIIIGAGAAGLFAASQMGKELKVLILESNNAPGKKILISGGGKANFTNLDLDFKNYLSHSKKFSKFALCEYRCSDFLKFIDRHKISYFEKKMGQLFCKKSAKEILNALLYECEENNVEIIYNTKNIKIDFKENFHVNEYIGKKLIVATGALSFEKLGASDFGYRLAKKFGHKITATRPALVGLRHKGFTSLAGNSLVAKVKTKNFEHTEDLLFTHKGFSGPVILKTSLFWEENLKLSINFLPNFDLEKDFAKLSPKIKLNRYFDGKMTKKVTQFFLARAQIDGSISLQEISKKKLNNLVQLLQHYQFIPSGTDGYSRAEVTAGGICTKLINDQTMESSLRPGLFFIGEVLDVTGQLGGHNFQWAWSSAFVAARSIRNILK